MSVRFVLAPQAALDLVEIWRYIKEQTSLTIADRVESAIREKIAFLAGTPGAGHSRKDFQGQSSDATLQGGGSFSRVITR
ncbi:MAG: hypothetical protein DMG55_05295 [Acidobacteria bacterium]|nr:MAG: hypothetical protein DMG55_05295 [Acidobacteriota bacterium]